MSFFNTNKYYYLFELNSNGCPFLYHVSWLELTAASLLDAQVSVTLDPFLVRSKAGERLNLYSGDTSMSNLEHFLSINSTIFKNSNSSRFNIGLTLKVCRIILISLIYTEIFYLFKGQA